MSEAKHPKVMIIPAEAAQTVSADTHASKLRVAAYCRVSTSSDEQLSSYQAQLEYYLEKVKSNPQWALTAIYADQGVTGTSTKHRKRFIRMIKDCEKGKIDLIITKSVSRFSRNTLDGLEYIRKLKSIGVGVYFEKENINTLIMDNEMILTFMMTAAQAESESMSGNVKWGHRKNFKDGKVYYHYNNFLGYREGEDGKPEIASEEAEIIKRIFTRYLQGQSVAKIITELEADGIKTVRGNTKWSDGVIRNMLTNEKYMGDALLQKTFVSDIFTRRSEKNMGQLPKYYVQECHPAIIDSETFQRVQEEMARRSSLPRKSNHGKTQLSKYSSKYALSERLVCGTCGAFYRRVTWTRSNEKKIVWRCLARLELGKKSCDAPTAVEETLHQAIVNSLNSHTDKTVFTEALMAAVEMASDSEVVRERLRQLLEDKKIIVDEYNDNLTRQLIQKIVVLDEDRFEIVYK
ncbi:MAG TPA: recombinase family protein [Syntrophomonas sp.]|nr:recombinase family protein [Syntrophomonas sp.]